MNSESALSGTSMSGARTATGCSGASVGKRPDTPRFTAITAITATTGRSRKQAETKYDGLHAMDVYAALEEFNELVRPCGVVLSFGWNSWGMRSFPAFERVETKLLQRGPIHRDVIVTADRRTSGGIEGWSQ